MNCTLGHSAFSMLLVAGLSLLLSSCTTGGPLAETLAQEEPISISVPANCGMDLDPDAYSISLAAGRTVVLINGIEFDLSVPPVVQNGSFYVPLQDLVLLFGGSYSFQDDAATIQLWDRTIVFYLQRPEVELDGVLYRLKDQPEWVDSYVSGSSYSRMEPADDYGPILLDGRVFLPNGMWEYLLGEFTSMYSYYDEEMLLICSRFIGEERGIDTVRVGDEYDKLSDEVRAQYEGVGAVYHVNNYSVLLYQNDAVAIYVLEADEGAEDMDSLDGRVCTIHVFGRGVPTPRGLQVSDLPYRAWLLYGQDSLTGSFAYQIRSGAVESYTFYDQRFFMLSLLNSPQAELPVSNGKIIPDST